MGVLAVDFMEGLDVLGCAGCIAGISSHAYWHDVTPSQVGGERRTGSGANRNVASAWQRLGSHALTAILRT